MAEHAAMVGAPAADAASTRASAARRCATSRTRSPSSRAPRRRWRPRRAWASVHGGAPGPVLVGRPRRGHAPGLLGHLRAARHAPAPLRHRRHLRRRHRRRRHRRRRASRARTQVVFVETPANPALSLVDLDAVGAIAGPITVVDSTFAGPDGAAAARPRRRPRAPRRHQGHRRPQRRPARRGRRQRRAHRRRSGRGSRRMGAQASPFDAWNGIRGIRTLPARGPPAVRDGARSWRRSSRATRRSRRCPTRTCRATRSTTWPSARCTTRRHRRHLRGGRRRRRRRSPFIERCRLARIALSLGGPETLLTHPATIAGRYTPAERAELGITDGLVRMSVGLEHADDLEADLAQALSG